MRTLITLGLLAVLISAAAALEQPGLLRADAAAALGAGELSGGRKHNDEQDKRPNIIFILTDNQDAVMGGDWHMPKLRRHLANEGINFTSYFTNFALCCPSRSTILAGQCSHNSGVVGVGGDKQIMNPLGGFQRFNDMGMERKTVAYHLQQAGYRTGLVGKYLNGFTRQTAFYVPPGWDRWFGIGEIDYYNWTASDNGVNVEFGDRDEDYSTDVLTEKGVEFIHQYEQDRRPFFLYLAPYACHRPHMPAARHIGAFKGLKVPRVPSWNESEALLKQKVSFIKDLPHIDDETADAYDFEYQTRAETLLAVDDMIEAVVHALEDVGQLENTYIFYTPDNGFKLGHHRLGGKMTAYENDIRLPFYVRSPKGPKGVKLPHLVGNVDLTPTWLDVAGVADPHAHERDGISMKAIIDGDAEAVEHPDRHRVGILVEKPVTTGITDMHVSILVPEAIDPSNDPFAGRRPQRLPNGSWPAQVLDTEFQGRHFNALTEARLKSDSFYFGYDKDAGFVRYLELAKQNGLTRDGIVKAANEIFPTAYYGLRTQKSGVAFKYIEYPAGHELFNLTADPHELHNIYATAPRELITDLAATLATLKVCKGESCVVKSLSVTEPQPV